VLREDDQETAADGNRAWRTEAQFDEFLLWHREELPGTRSKQRAWLDWAKLASVVRMISHAAM
jgi:hypothetical protein